MRFVSYLVLGSITLGLGLVGCSGADSTEVEPLGETESAVTQSSDDANGASEALALIDDVFDVDALKDRDRDFGRDRDLGGDRDRDILERNARDRIRCGKLDVLGPDMRIDFGPGCDMRSGLHVKGLIAIKVLMPDADGPGISINFKRVVVRGVVLDGGVDLRGKKSGGWRARFDKLGRDGVILDGDLGIDGPRDRRVLDGDLGRDGHPVLKKIRFEHFVLERDHCFPREGSIGWDKGVLDFDKDSPDTGMGRVKIGDGPAKTHKLRPFGPCADKR